MFKLVLFIVVTCSTIDSSLAGLQPSANFVALIEQIGEFIKLYVIKKYKFYFKF